MDTKLSLQMAQKLDREISNTVKKEERKLLSFIPNDCVISGQNK